MYNVHAHTCILLGYAANFMCIHVHVYAPVQDIILPSHSSEFAPGYNKVCLQC